MWRVQSQVRFEKGFIARVPTKNLESVEQQVPVHTIGGNEDIGSSVDRSDAGTQVAGVQ